MEHYSVIEYLLLGGGIFLCSIMAVSLSRTVIGPTVVDRILGVNAIGSKTTVLLIMIGFIYKREDMFVDIALAYALLNFITVLAASKYFQKRKGL